MNFMLSWLITVANTVPNEVINKELHDFPLMDVFPLDNSDVSLALDFGFLKKVSEVIPIGEVLRAL